ncbi:MAG: alpha/beta fold hydrolase [Pseudomonadota bacterium]|nr:alpha/beta fold hydrolase [Pseudomonadota bacterium]
MTTYQQPSWLPGGHAQTIWPALYARRVCGLRIAYRRERWDTPDGDFIDVDWLGPGPGYRPAANAPLVVLFHGLEGSSRSHYAEAFAGWAREHGLRFAVPHFRGCSGELNCAPRAYHSGDFTEVGWLLARFRAEQAARGGGPLLVVGVSLGGNVLLRWAGEAGTSAATVVGAVAAVCSPLDLAAGALSIGRGFNRQVYTRMFMRTLKAKARAKLAQHAGLFDAARLTAARDLVAFDEVFTAPLHGFASASDYYRRASAKPVLANIRVPALALNARNDPFVPAASLPCVGEVGRHVTLWQPGGGGHVGFCQGHAPGHVFWLPRAVGGWLLAHAGTGAARIMPPHG